MKPSLIEEPYPAPKRSDTIDVDFSRQKPAELQEMLVTATKQMISAFATNAPGDDRIPPWSDLNMRIVEASAVALYEGGHMGAEGKFVEDPKKLN